ncbi:MAG: hypothetical protein ABEK59_05745 [Halobacteria archaeon]
MSKETVEVDIPIEMVAKIDKTLMGMGTSKKLIQTNSVGTKIEMLLNAIHLDPEESPDSLSCEHCGSNAQYIDTAYLNHEDDRLDIHGYKCEDCEDISFMHNVTS